MFLFENPSQMIIMEGSALEQTAYLILENGQIFKGQRFGADGDITGEIVFTTSMIGYLETLTDPSYYGQMVVQTFPLIGNYGVIPSDFESDSSHVKAYIVREWCQEPSNFRSEGNLDAFLKSQNVIGIYNIDTRALTRILREYGVMNARITSSAEDIQASPENLKKYKVDNAVSSVSRDKPYELENSAGKYKIVLWDFGAKANIRRELEKRECQVIVAPAGATASEIIAMKPDGVVLSNGPGDPKENPEIIKEISKLCEAKIPMFSVSLGHLLLALSQGAQTVRLKYGHHGGNQPVKQISTGRLYVTSQNHNYAVDGNTLPKNAAISFVNANDGTPEGIEYSDMPAFSVQFHPEAAAGPLDTCFMFDKFIDMIKEGR
ncbi:MAG: carbamoyl phosphate synthase small subunit [Oscillospiraceae bacterium]|nr:carbamoyl phosphate synthase small subunit [Oscillospiraceae bacterium]